MKLIYEGKTKDVYEGEDGNYILKFKDDMTGKDGVFDPGANEVGLTIEGVGQSGLRLTKYFYEKLNERNIPTHYVDSNVEENEMTVLPAKMFGKGVEVICRYRAVGSFIRRYGLYAEDGDKLDGYIEVTLKDDERNDPLITDTGLEMLGIMSKEEYEEVVKYTRYICDFVRDELANKGLELYDIKLEFARVGEDNHIALIDEISGGSMRVYKGDRKLDPFEIEKILLEA